MKTTQEIFEDLQKDIVASTNISSIGKVSPSSPHSDCNASFFIYLKNDRTKMVHTSSVRKANNIIKLLTNWK